MISHRAQALRAIEHVIEMLAAPEALDGFHGLLARTTLVYAAEEVKAIQEVRRVRRKPKVEDDRV